MRIIRTIPVLLPFLVLRLSAQNPTIIPGGVVNSYHAVLDVACNTAELSSVAGLKSGDRFMIIQMKAGVADSANSPSYANPFLIDEPSNFELGYIHAIIGNKVVFRYPLVNKYDVRYKVQLVRVAVYDYARITANVYASPWNGATGGIVAIEVNYVLYLEGDIIVNGAGFSGGIAGPPATAGACVGCINQNVYAAAYTGANGGFKGEGIFELVSPRNTGTMPNINGGGAGTCKNGGGGGGSNAGAGGKGGNSSNECGLPVETSAGKGGIPLPYSSFPSRAFLGGGGGGGNQDNDPPEGSGGGAGGGLIYLKTPVLRTYDFVKFGSIHANGYSSLTAARDGAGGGGAGGTVLLAIDSSRNLIVTANGAKGADVILGREDSCYAPGGGGGGGIIRMTPTSSSNISILDVRAGESGLIEGVYAPCNKTNYGADSGRYGVILHDLVLREAVLPLPPFSLGKDTVLCESTPIVLNAGTNRKKITWSNNTSNQTFTPPGAGIYWVEIVDLYGCTLFDTIEIFEEGPRLELGNDTLVCPGVEISKSVSALFNTVLWSTGSTSDSISTRKAGKLWVEVTRASGCRFRDSVIINHSSEAIDLGVDTVICIGQALMLDAGKVYPSYLWSNGLSGRYNIVARTDTVWVLATSDIGCLVTDTIIVQVKPGKIVDLGPDTMSCSGISIRLDADSGFKSYMWVNNETTQSILVDLPGIYWVKTIDSNGCKDADTISVIIADLTDTLYIPNCFTPNRDGRNDHFPGNELEGISDFEIHIYNTFGEKVFYSSDADIRWDGNYMGRPAQAGVYLYIVKWKRCSGRYKNVKGTFTLIR